VCAEVRSLIGQLYAIEADLPSPHALEMLTKVPAARLVILPATSHIGISGEAKVLESMVTPFLEDAPPANPSLW
jgi:hypothetical protein